MLKQLKPFGIELDFIGSGSAIVELLKEHSLIVIRGHALRNTQDFIDFAKTMGELMAWDFGLVNELKLDEHAKNYLYSSEAVPFHWDGAFKSSPAALLFHCLQAPDPDAEGETLFTHTTRMYEHASEAQKRVWSTLKISYETEAIAHYGGKITEPLVGQHPYTGEPILRYAEPVVTERNPVFTSIMGMTPSEQEAFKDDMACLIRHDDYCYTHKWQDGDILIADNHALIHGRNAIKKGSPRHIRRVQVATLNIQEFFR